MQRAWYLGEIQAAVKVRSSAEVQNGDDDAGLSFACIAVLHGRVQLATDRLTALAIVA
jgi:hypothetical protein